MVPISYYLVLSAILFALGVVGFLIKRNLITLFMSIELMLNAVNLAFVAFAWQWRSLNGQVLVFFVMVVAAAEAAVGLAIIIAVFPTRVVALVGNMLVGASCVMAWWIFAQFLSLPREMVPYVRDYAAWIRAGSFAANYGVYLDQLSMVMVLVVTNVGFLIHIYSIGYM